MLCVKQLSGGVPLPSPQAVQVLELLSTFSVLFSIKLFTLHDAEFHKDKESKSIWRLSSPHACVFLWDLSRREFRHIYDVVSVFQLP